MSIDSKVNTCPTEAILSGCKVMRSQVSSANTSTNALPFLQFTSSFPFFQLK